ncbi:MAG: hypothetical protein M1834_001691 [Cirrosporium novae-zelandiae]|nr:MAG: hypothetical protein M1834_001691 [Cirrosporium novae-zelandiae]
MRTYILRPAFLKNTIPHHVFLQAPSSFPPRAFHLTITTILLLFSTVLTTLLSTHLPPNDTNVCTLSNHWRNLFSAKNDRSIRHIQDSLACCGLKNSHDMAWPFPAKGVSADACEKMFPDRKSGCLKGWMGFERQEMGLLFMVGFVVAVGELFVLFMTLRTRPSWIEDLFSSRNRNGYTITEEDDGGDAEAGDSRPIGKNRRIQSATRSHDDEDGDEASGENPRAVANGGDHHEETDGENRSGHVVPSGLLPDRNEWRNQ